MLPKYAYYIIAIASSAAASPLAAQNDTCWTGQIHSPCNGAQTGCTPDGILVSVIDHFHSDHGPLTAIVQKLEILMVYFRSGSL